jgi:predicted molibdopterin-dependent oxidoreductase YjgC
MSLSVNGSDRLVPACTKPAQEGMTVMTTSPKLASYRRMIIELLLVDRNRVSAVVRAYDPCLSCSTHAQWRRSNQRRRAVAQKVPAFGVASDSSPARSFFTVPYSRSSPS